MDTRTGRVLVGKNYHEKLPVASLTKIVTACVALDWLEGTNGDRNRMITIPFSAMNLGGANPLGFQAGDQISIRDALFCALMASDNIAAETLAENLGNEMLQRAGQAPGGGGGLGFGKTGRSSGTDFFVAQMNALAKRQGMDRSNFVNSHGLDSDKPKGYSTAADMAKITVYAIEKPSFNFIVSQPQREVSYLRAGQEMRFLVHNTNKMLSMEGVDGVKTGRTTRAGDCLIISVRKQDKIQELQGNQRLRIPYHLIVVTLDSSDRFGQATYLVGEGWRNYEGWLAAGLPAKPGEFIPLVTKP